MSRLLLAVFTLIAVMDFTNIQAQNYGSPAGWGQQAGWGYPRGTTGYRFGYLYDPYASGSFRAPDLMDDPSFRAKQRVGRLFYSDQAPQPHYHQHAYPHPTYRVPMYRSH